MMDFNAVLAGLSAAAYVEGTPDKELVGLPPGVTRLPGALGHTAHSSSGFEASAFLYDGKIVISFAGTTDWRDGVADVALAGGASHSQLEEAALFYQQVKAWAIAEYGAGYADNIVFTGHSLGGGLAARLKRRLGGLCEGIGEEGGLRIVGWRRGVAIQRTFAWA